MEPLELGFSEPTDNDVPWFEDENDKGTLVGAPLSSVSSTLEDHKDYEIYKKAEHFKSLKLLSGSAMSLNELETFVRKNYGKIGIFRLQLAKKIMSSLNYNPSPDVLLMLACTRSARVVIATAGAGKTTSLQTDIAISKILDKALGLNELAPMKIEGTSVEVPRILYLNYNKHNVQPIAKRHTAVCTAVNKIFKKDDSIDDSIDSTTVHAFCLRWLKAFSSEVDLPDLKIMSDEQKTKIWGAIIQPRWKKYYPDSDFMVEYPVLDDLYNFKTESTLDWDDFFLTSKFVDAELKPEFVKACIKKYDAMKKQMMVVDFTDYLVLMIDVLRTHPELKQRLQERYKVIIADENQDFTRLMNDLLLELYSPDKNKLIVVGDPDQTIYAFKGVSPDNVVYLCEKLEDMELLGLDTNYRCPDGIVDAAKSILNLNILRFEKPIQTVRTGGKIIQHPIIQGELQDKAVMDLVRRIDPTCYSDTVITYRNNISSLIIAEELYYAGIPFNILDDRRPFSNLVFRNILTGLRSLYEKDNFQLNCELYRFLPVTKDIWIRILELNREQRRNHLHDLQMPSPVESLPKGTMDALATLVRISEIIDTAPVCDYIGPLIRLYRTYYFDYRAKPNNPYVTDNENYQLYLERAVKFFSRHMTFEYMLQEYRERNKDNPAGITLSTFHGLKGLEFDYVIAIDFVDSCFPNYMGIEQKYTENTALEEKESENRLCYVLVTRTIKELHLFYSATDPSVYVGILMKTFGDISKDTDSEKEITLGPISGINSTNARMSFIQRLIDNGG